MDPPEETQLDSEHLSVDGEMAVGVARGREGAKVAVDGDESACIRCRLAGSCHVMM